MCATGSHPRIFQQHRIVFPCVPFLNSLPGSLFLDQSRHIPLHPPMNFPLHEYGSAGMTLGDNVVLEKIVTHM